MRKRFDLIIIIFILLVSLCITSISVAAEESPTADSIIRSVGRQAIEDYVKDHASATDLPENYRLDWDAAVLISTPGKDFLSAAEKEETDLLVLLMNAAHPRVSIPILVENDEYDSAVLLRYSYEKKEYVIDCTSSSNTYRVIHTEGEVDALCRENGVVAEGYQPFILSLGPHDATFILVYGEADWICDPAGIIDDGTLFYTPAEFATAFLEKKDALAIDLDELPSSLKSFLTEALTKAFFRLIPWVCLVFSVILVAVIAICVWRHAVKKRSLKS